MVDAIDLSMDIPWMIIEMDIDEESNDIEQDTEPMVEPPKILSFYERIEIVSTLITIEGVDEGLYY